MLGNKNQGRPQTNVLQPVFKTLRCKPTGLLNAPRCTVHVRIPGSETRAINVRGDTVFDPIYFNADT